MKTKLFASIYLLVLCFCGCKRSSTPDEIIAEKISIIVEQVQNNRMPLKAIEELSHLIMANTNDVVRKKHFVMWARSLFEGIGQIEGTGQIDGMKLPNQGLFYVEDIVTREISCRLNDVSKTEVLRFELMLDLIDWQRRRLEDIGNFILHKWGDVDLLSCKPGLDEWGSCYRSLFLDYRLGINRLEGGSGCRALFMLEPARRERIVEMIEKRLGRKMRSPEKAREDLKWEFDRGNFRKVERHLFPWPPKKDAESLKDNRVDKLKEEPFEDAFNFLVTSSNMNFETVQKITNDICDRIANVSDVKEAVRLYDRLLELAVAQEVSTQDLKCRLRWNTMLCYISTHAFVCAQKRLMANFKYWDKLFRLYSKYVNEIVSMEKMLPKGDFGSWDSVDKSRHLYLRDIRAHLSAWIRAMQGFDFPKLTKDFTEEQKADIMRRFKEVEKYTVTPPHYPGGRKIGKEEK